MRKLILTLPIAALVFAIALLCSDSGGVFAGSDLPTNSETIVATNQAADEQAADDWVETAKKKPKPKKSAHKP